MNLHMFSLLYNIKLCVSVSQRLVETGHRALKLTSSQDRKKEMKLQSHSVNEFL